MNLKFRPLCDRVLVKPDLPPTLSRGGLHLPATAHKPPSLRGVVVAAGPGMPTLWGRWPMPVKPGDHIVFAYEPGLPVKIDGEDYLLMRDDNILAIETFEESAE